jgi:arabinoxylan arabinofuranohydrolase
MKRARIQKLVVGVVMIIAIALVTICYADNPIIQTKYTADPAPMVYKDTVYLYTSHDEDDATGFHMLNWMLYTSTDMVNWTDHGVVASLNDFSWARHDNGAWAPQCIERNGKFYFYCPIHGNGIGVLVSDSPYGPFKDPLGKRLIETDHLWNDIDPSPFIDDDGQAYLYWGNPNLYYVKLSPDMISYSGNIVKVASKPNNYVEGPWFYKRKGIYYMIFSTVPSPAEAIGYSTSESPIGPWTYQGIIMPTQGNSFTNHAGIIDYKGNSYFFYHNGALSGGGSFTRSVCVEQFEYNADGSMPTFNMTTAGIVNGVGHLHPYQRIEAETFAWGNGIETASSSETGVYVADIDSGDYIKVRGVDFGATGAGTFTATVSSDTKARALKGGTIEMHLDEINGDLIGTIPVSYTGGWDKWKIETTNITGASGIHDLYFVFKGEVTGDLFNFDNWKFEEKKTEHELVTINASIDNYKIDTLSGSNTTNIKVVAIYADGTSEDVTSQADFTSEQKGIVSIANGIVTGVAYGTVTLGVNYSGKADEIKLIVKNLESELAVKQLLADNSNVEIFSGTSLPLKITAEFYDGHTEIVTKKANYTNPHPEIAIVTNGIITAKSNGTTTVTVSFKGEMGETKTTNINITVSNRDPYAQNEAEDFYDQSGIQTETCSDTYGGTNIGYIENGDWIKFSNLDFGTEASSFEARVASATSGGNIELHLDSLTGTLIGTCIITGTGGWQTWVTRSCNVTGATGMHDLYLKFIGGSGYLFNINWWKFSGSEITAPASKSTPTPAEVGLYY